MRKLFGRAAAGFALLVWTLSLSSSPSFAGGADAAPAASASAAAPTWEEFSGYKRYHGNCSTCHGPDGLGGTFAPNLTKSLKTLDHDAFVNTVVNGKQNAQLAMPSFGVDPNVMCYLEDIYTYLKARSDDKLPRGRPAPQPVKPAAFAATETACMGQ